DSGPGGTGRVEAAPPALAPAVNPGIMLDRPVVSQPASNGGANPAANSSSDAPSGMTQPRMPVNTGSLLGTNSQSALVPVPADPVGNVQRPMPPVGAPPAAFVPSSAPWAPAPVARAPVSSSPRVESYEEETYVCQAGDDFRSISRLKYYTDKYERALL